MKLACVAAIADLAMRESTDVVASAYRGESLNFGPEYLIPKPFDPRLIVEVSLATAKAAMDSGVATRPISDLNTYRARLQNFSYRGTMFMQPVIEIAKRDREKIVYAEGENQTVLRAVQAVVDEGIAEPILIGRRKAVLSNIESLGLRIQPETDFELVDPEDDPRYRDYWELYHSLVSRNGVSVSAARDVIRTNTTAIAACMVVRGEAHAMICGAVGRFDHHLQDIIEIVGCKSAGQKVSSMSVLILPGGPLFIADTHISIDPTADNIADTTLACVDRIRDFGLIPKVALLSHSNFGSSKAPQAKKMREALGILTERAPNLEIDGEMHASTALKQAIRDSLDPNSSLKGAANLLIMPNLDAANISMELLRTVNDALLIGPLLSGTKLPAHIVTPSSSAKGIFNMSAIAVADVWRDKNQVQ